MPEFGRDLRTDLNAGGAFPADLGTLVTTGDAAPPTPLGWYTLYAKYSPSTFISPWSRGSRFWYPLSRVSFALGFASGYFNHNASWRSVYGPKSNVSNEPGANYGGTHGCVKVPSWAERFLYAWAALGTPVHIVA